MLIKGVSVEFIKADITQLDVDAIVNAANNRLVMGGGLAAVIKRKGGKEIEKEAVKKGPIKIGEAIYTKAGKLSSKYVIHAATMGLPVGKKKIFKTDEIKIRNSCSNSLKVAKKLKIESIAIPALGCGVGKFPFLACAKIIAQEIFRFIRENTSNLKRIILCLYNDNAYNIFDKTVNAYLRHIQEKLEQGPFSTVDIIIETKEGIVIVKRSNPPFGWALPGGFVDYNESLETTARREAKEETGLNIYNLCQFHTYSEPGRDPRFHTISTVFTAKAKGKPKAASDAAASRVIRLEEIKKIHFAFDHKKILEDYLKTRK